MVWTSPEGQHYATHPGSRVLFPTLCEPTAPVADPIVAPTPASGLMMPRRKHTRAYNRQRAIVAERALNNDHVAERTKPPPF